MNGITLLGIGGMFALFFFAGKIEAKPLKYTLGTLFAITVISSAVTTFWG